MSMILIQKTRRERVDIGRSSKLARLPSYCFYDCLIRMFFSFVTVCTMCGTWLLSKIMGDKGQNSSARDLSSVLLSLCYHSLRDFPIDFRAICPLRTFSDVADLWPAVTSTSRIGWWPDVWLGYSFEHCVRKSHPKKLYSSWPDNIWFYGRRWNAIDSVNRSDDSIHIQAPVIQHSLLHPLSHMIQYYLSDL